MSEISEYRRVPSSTYRLQLHCDFPVQAVIELLEYLHDLGVGSVYLSPILKARPGSPHGYDVVDPDLLNPELGTPAEFRVCGEMLQRMGMGLIVDVVPNHMSITDANWRWVDVLENGPSSPYAQFFDIDWRPPREDLGDKVLLPVLGDQYGRVLENGEICLEYNSGALRISYAGSYFPVAPRTWLRILDPVANALRSRLGEADAAVTELESIMTALSYLPLRTETDERRVRERQREKEIIKSRVARLIEASADVRKILHDSIRRINGAKGTPSSFDDLEGLLSDQAYRLSYWRVAADEINYRRFFDVNDLASIRVEEAAVFDAVHRNILEGIREGWINGLRVDHPDGLYDPAGYFKHLQSEVRRVLQLEETGEPSWPLFYVVAEKIMTTGERPRRDWPVDGTTGYGFLNELNGLFVDPSAQETMKAVYSGFTGRLIPFSDLACECKRLILRVSLSSELNVLSRRLDRICQQHRHTRDFTLESLRFALSEVIACFPVYRTYVAQTQNSVDEEDRRQILRAITEARHRNSAVNQSIFNSISSILLLEDPAELSAQQKMERRLFVMRFQQLTGPVMAKGVEDTAFYRQFPLASLNEVGGDPDTFGIDTKTFHAKIARRLSQWPHNLLSTSTHDSKRSEDVRARLNVLSEIPGEWQAAVHRWSGANEPLRTVVENMRAPDPEAEYLFYQTVVGTLPLEGLLNPQQREQFSSRIQEYMAKALREAKVRTSWINPNVSYETAVRQFVAGALRPAEANEFLPDIERFAASISRPGLLNSLSQTVLKLMCPGVPDIYQGNELWNFSLVDPDNRRPVDYELRKRLLAELPLESTGSRSDWLRGAAATLADGRLKLFITAAIARFRREHQHFFMNADYRPLEAVGPLQDHVVCFSRSTRERIVVVVVGRLFAKLGSRDRNPTGEDVWRDLRINLGTASDGSYHDVLSGSVVDTIREGEQSFLPVSRIFSFLPVSVLVDCRRETCHGEHVVAGF